MPVLPQLETAQSVFSSGFLGPQQINATPDDFGGQVAQAGKELGGALQQVSGNAFDIEMRKNALQNEATVNDTYANQFSPALRDVYQKYYSLQGKDAVDQLPAFQKQLQDLQTQTRSQLENPLQQQAFDQMSRKRIEMELDGMTRYADTQNKVFQKQTSDGMVNAFQIQAADKYNDPIVFNGMVNSVAVERLSHAAATGEPVEYAKAQIAKDVSNMWSSRLQTMANADPLAAYDMFQNGENWSNGQTSQHTDVKSAIEPALRPTLEAHLLNGAKQVMARNVARDAIYGGQMPDPAHLYDATQGAPPLTAVVQKLEGGTDAHGNSLTSPKGAQGPMQVMPTTQTNPGYGVTPAKDNSPAEIARVGRDYLGAMTARYQDPALILAAYNAGPGTVDDWLNGTNKTGKNPNNVQLPDPRSGAISDADFSAKIPFSETRAYVGKGLTLAQQPGNKPTALPTTSELKTLLPSMVEQARAVATRMYPNDPAFADMVASRTANNGNTILQGVTAQENAARDTLTRMMIGNKPDGSDRVSSVDQLLATPQGKQAWSQATPEVQRAIQDSLAKPQNTPMTPEGFKLFYQMKGMSVNDPNKFAQQDLSGLYGQMPMAQILELTNVQAGLAKHDANQEEKSLNWSRTKGDVDDMLKPIGLGNVAKEGTDESKQTEQFYGKLQSALEDYHDQNQKYPDAIMTRKIAAGLLVQGVQTTPGILWDSHDTIAAFQSKDLSKFQPPQNDKGWTLQVDKNGNQAYVSPDRKQFEAVK